MSGRRRAPELTGEKGHKRLKSLAEVLAPVDALARALEQAAPPRSLADLALSASCREVADLPAAKVVESIERAVYAVARSIMAGRGFRYAVPSRGNANQLYVPELDRIVLKEGATERDFADQRQVHKATITTRILQLLHEVCTKGIHVSKRDLFYTDVKLFEEQAKSDTVLDDVACMLCCTRSSLHVVASAKGVVVGRLTFREDGDAIDCSKVRDNRSQCPAADACRCLQMGVGGKSIPPNTDKVTELRSDAKFILLVEKDAAYVPPGIACSVFLPCCSASCASRKTASTTNSPAFW